MSRRKSPEKAAIIARSLIDGYTAKDAAMRAGYAESTAESRGHELAKREDVRAELLRLGRGYTNADIGALARARLAEILEKNEVEPRVLVAAIRTAAEIAGDVGQKDATISHELVIPIAAQEMIARKVVELQQKINNSLPGEVVNADTRSPLPLEDVSVGQESPIGVQGQQGS